MKSSTYFYTNKLGREKKLIVYNADRDNESKVYNVIIDVVTGKYCGSGYNTDEQIKNFLTSYGVEYNLKK
jgi:hypothetical protein